MKKTLMTLAGLGSACAACCLPFAAPALAAVGAGGLLSAKLAGVSVDAILCKWGPLVLLALAAGFVFRAIYRHRRDQACGCATSCQIS